MPSPSHTDFARILLDASTENFALLIDTKGTVVDANAAMATRFGRTVEQLKGSNIYKLLAPEVAKQRRAYARTVIRTRQPAYFEDQNQESWFKNSAYPILDSSGKVTQIATLTCDITELKATEKLLRQKGRQCSLFFEYEPEYCYMISPQGKILNVNRAALKVLGYKKHELIGQPVQKIYAPESAAKAGQLFREWKTTGILRNAELRIISKNGVRRTVLLSVDAVKDTAGKIVYSISIQRDIEELAHTRERLRQEKEKLNHIVSNIPIVSYTARADVQCSTTYVSERIEALTGYKAKSFLRKGSFWFDHIHPEDQKIIRKKLHHFLNSSDEDTVNIWYRFKHASGAYIWIEDILRMIRTPEGKPDYIIGALYDVSERKRMREALQEEKEFFETAINALPDTFFVFDPRTGEALRWNQTFARISGFTDAEISRQRVPNTYYSSADTKLAQEAIQKTLKKGQNTVELSLICKDKRIVPTEYSASVIRDEQDKVENVIAVGRDITERKKMEYELRQHRNHLEKMVKQRTDELQKTNQKLRQEIRKHQQSKIKLQESEAKFKTFVSESMEAVYLHDLDGKIIEVNKTAVQDSGYTRKELLGMTAFDIDPDLKQIKHLKKSWKTARPYQFQTFQANNKNKKGRLYPVEVKIGKIVLNKQAYILALAQNISERTTAETLKQESEERFRIFMEKFPGIVFINDGKGRTVFGNQSICQFYGCTKKEYVGKKIAQLAGPKLAAKMVAEDKKVIATGRSLKFEEMVSNSPEPRYWITHKFPIPSHDQRVLVGGLAIEITDRKQVEGALQESKQRLLKAQSIARMGFLDWDVQNNTIVLSEQVCHMYQLDPKKVLHKPELVLQRVHPDDFEYVKKNLDLAVKGTRKFDIDHRILRPDGSIIWVHAQAEPEYDAAGKPKRLLGAAIDITERKQTASALSQKKQQLKSILDNIQGITYRCKLDRDWTMIYLTPFVKTLTGYPLTDFIQNHTRSFASIIHSDDSKRIRHNVRTAIKAKQPWEIEYRIRHKDGRTIWVYEKGEAVFDEKGKVTHLDGFIINISERKKTQELLQKSEEKYRGIFDESVAAIYVFDTQKNCIDVNQAGLDLLGYSKKEVLHMNMSDVDVDPQAVLLGHQQLLSGGKVINYEHQLKRKDGSIITVLNNSRPLTDTKGNIVGIQSTLIDITKRKIAEAAVQKKEAESRHLLQTMLNGFVYMEAIYDKKGKLCDARYLDMNASYEQFTGLKKKTAIGKTVLELMPKTEQAWFNILGDVVARGTPKGFEMYHEHTQKFYSVRAYRPTKDHFAAFFEDITEGKEYERRLQLTQHAVDRSLMPHVWFDTDGHIIYANEAAAQHFGYPIKKILTMSPADIDPNLHHLKPKVVDHLKQYGHYTFESTHYHRSGRVIPVEVKIHRIQYAEQRYFVVNIRDLTEQKKLDKAKDDFIMLASHQLRTPLTTIKLYTESLSKKITSRPKLYDDCQDDIKKINRAYERISRLVDDLLNASMTSLKKDTIKIEEVQFAQMADGEIESVLKLETDKDIRVIRRYKKNRKVLTDKRLLQTSLQNLIENAFKYTPDGGRVSIGIRKKGSDLILSVSDTGYGIPLKEQSKIFGRFFRANNVATTIDGSGFGLHVLKTILQNCGGDIWFESKENVGSTFFVKLPTGS